MTSLDRRPLPWPSLRAAVHCLVLAPSPVGFATAQADPVPAAPAAGLAPVAHLLLRCRPGVQPAAGAPLPGSALAALGAQLRVPEGYGPNQVIMCAPQ